MPYGIRSILNNTPLGIKAAKSFVEKAKAVHGDKYIYANVEYLGANKKIEIVCPIHGPFMQTPSMHINEGNGCPSCYSDKRKFIGEKVATNAGGLFKSKAIQIHGNRYDYAKVNYLRSSLPVEIICPTHGSFFQAPGSHLQGVGCNKCKLDSHKNRMDAVKNDSGKEFESKSIKVHGNKYGYAKTKYIDTETKLIINCPYHGDFLQSPNKHLSGQGCPLCGKEQIEIFYKARTLKAKNEFVSKANSIHANKYRYDDVEYVDARTKVIIKCPIHGLFKQVPDTHLAGKGCLKCRTDLIREMQQKAVLEHGKKFPERALKVHGDKYDYSRVEYKGKDEHVIIICPKHREFPQSPNKHLQGNGCPQCAMELNLGEEEVSKILMSYGINYDRQYSPDWGKKIGQKRYGVIYDFAIHDLKILIERDGEQHYQPVRFGGISKERANAIFEKQKQVDKFKTELAISNGWILCRIPYYCDNIPEEVINIISGNPTYPTIPDYGTRENC